ncbi:MAG: TatD family hydrolase [Pyrinomonadaceae bacterium]
MFVDSHAHIDGPEYDTDRDEVIARARAAGVQTILNVGTGDPQSGAFERAVLLAESQEDVLAAIGVHPHDAKLYDDAAENRIKNLITKSSRVIAWGEIGLDFHYDNSPRDIQREVFRRQLRAARERSLPVIIHTRDADDDTIVILQAEYSGATRGGIMHCFGGSLNLARVAIDLGFLVSFSGNVTFKKAQDIRDVAKQIPPAHLLIETDCPYLSPIPFRGRRNEPARVVEVARCLAELHDVSLEEIGRATTANFTTIFQLDSI